MIRPRRNRKSKAIRDLVQETRLDIKQLVYPLFIVDGEKKKLSIESMPGIFKFSIDELLLEIADCVKLGIHSFILFPSVDASKKDTTASYSYAADNFYLKAIEQIKTKYGEEVVVITDVAMDPYSSDGHDGVVKDGKILNDETLPILGKMAVAQAKVGADIIGPSDMMDGRVAYIREALNEAGFTETSIMSYAAKYASAFYGPFRDALDSTPGEGDKKTYQMNPANSIEAIREAELDELEGADFLMVKPALPYLDIIKSLKDNFDLPIVAYNVSGEYSMLKAAAEKGWLDEKAVMEESLLSIRRAGADIVISYFAKEYAMTRI